MSTPITIATELIPVVAEIVKEVLAMIEKGDIPPQFSEVFSDGIASEVARAAARRKAERELGIDLP